MASVEVADGPLVIPARRPWRRANTRLLLGGAGLALIVLAAVFAPLLAPYDPIAQHLGDRLQGPSGAHLLGTDNLGRDLLSRLLYGLRPSLVSGLAAVALGAASGTVIGLSAGYFRGWLDVAISRVLDLLIAWPAIFLALGLVLLFAPGEKQVVLAIGLAELPVFARLVRAIALTCVRSEHVEAARSMGAPSVRVMRLHILPFAIPPLVVQFAVAAPQAVIAEASLNYLGLGTQPPAPSLGEILSDAQVTLSLSANGTVFTVVLIALLVLSLTLLADGLQDVLDPRHQAVTA
ncbi:MAG: ABC transporter permease [Mycobacteriales bacterium]